MAYRIIDNDIFRVKTHFGSVILVETSSISELYDAVSDLIIRGYDVESVTELRKNGTTPKASVLSNPDFKKMLKQKRKVDDDQNISEGTLREISDKYIKIWSGKN